LSRSDYNRAASLQDVDALRRRATAWNHMLDEQASGAKCENGYAGADVGWVIRVAVRARRFGS